MTITYNKVKIEGQTVFYREMGSPEKPVLLLLHGFPTASHMFRNLMPLLASKFRVIAPDFIGFGQSSAPDSHTFNYTFDNLAKYVNLFLEKCQITQFYMYVFDYGAPIGFRLAFEHPDSILGIISQNGNIYEAGLGKKWAQRRAYWAAPTPEARKNFESAFAPETIINQYLTGEAPQTISPDGYSLDIYYTSTPDYANRQSDLILDYRSNVSLYPQFQEYVRNYQPKLLAIWGKNDPSFIPQGARAFQADDPKAKVVLLNAGHFALESQYITIAEEIMTFF